MMKLLLVGGGNMGMALLGGWQKNIPGMDIIVVDPHPSDALKNSGVSIFTDISEIKAHAFDVVVLAVKPQSFADVLPALKKYTSAAFLSIAAGKSIAGMQENLGDGVAIIRAMPNTPALVAQGITVCVPNAHVSDTQKKTATVLLQSVGEVVWIDDENQMHAVTALSGSGPAYVFALIDAMAKAGKTNGLPSELAMRLARKTVQGAAELAMQSDKSATELRQQVTSPGGTTEAALKVILAEKNGIDNMMHAAITAATKRSQELA